MDGEANPRKSIPKSVRFEVFKRDSFKCQYCGATAPDVLLQLDHIKPRSKGGTNDITNLITACQPCNSGKSDKPLDDNTAVAKSRGQLEELQERREQLQMMMTWMEGMRDLRGEAIDRVCDYWHDLAPGFTSNSRHHGDSRWQAPQRERGERVGGALGECGAKLERMGGPPRNAPAPA